MNVASNFVAIAVPALYLTGMQDCLLAPSAADDLTGLRPDLEVAAIAAPHFILQRCPTQAANMISDFLLRRRAV